MVSPRQWAVGCWFVATAASMAAAEWVAGPMLGYRSHREVAIWCETRGADSVELVYQQEGRPETAVTLRRDAPEVSWTETQPQTFIVPLLEMGTTYTYSFRLDGVEVPLPGPTTFRTTSQWEYRGPPPDFSFLLGSCAYLNDAAYDRPGPAYGQSTGIFQHMAASGADFMIWGGDNVYLREADFSSRSGIWYRYSRDRSHPDLQPLLSVMHHYAIWDDHDFGPNDSNQTFEFKHETLAAFQAYWANPSAGQPDHPGIYTKFVWSDAAFFLLDSRYHRDESALDQELAPHKSVWGARQLEWLKQSLLHAQRLRHYAFKFIVTGGQFLQTADATTRTEAHEHFRRERTELLEFIRSHGITGVVFLTGDAHHSGLYRQTIAPGQEVYEITSSPLTSGSWKASLSSKGSDPLLVPGTLVETQNYCELTIRGAASDRELVVRSLDAANTLQWEHVIPLRALGVAVRGVAR